MKVGGDWQQVLNSEFFTFPSSLSPIFYRWLILMNILGLILFRFILLKLLESDRASSLVDLEGVNRGMLLATSCFLFPLVTVFTDEAALPSITYLRNQIQICVIIKLSDVFGYINHYYNSLK